jgi:L-Ala-D/L-Glu epimerase
LKRWAPALPELGVVLLEQPIAVGEEPALDGWCPLVPLAADESFSSATDLQKVLGRFAVVNIKLEKSGGLTAALALADQARAAGLRVMVGCMGGSSLAMAPGLVLAQHCEFVDLDGPLLQAQDLAEGLVYTQGWIARPQAGLWGS